MPSSTGLRPAGLVTPLHALSAAQLGQRSGGRDPGVLLWLWLTGDARFMDDARLGGNETEDPEGKYRPILK